MLTDEIVAKAFIILHLEGDCHIQDKLESKNLIVDGYELREKRSGHIVARYSCGDFHTSPPDIYNTMQKYTHALFEHVLAEYKETSDKFTLRNAIYSELDPVTGDYTQDIVDAIADDVIEDVHDTAADNWNVCDVHLAIGRVLCKRLGIEK